MKTPHTPAYRHHKARGLAVVTLGGKDYYLGQHGSPESIAEYDRLIAEWLANGRGKPPAPSKTDTTVAEAMAAYWRHCRAYYDVASTLENIRRALKPVKALYAHTAAATFGPKSLKAVRARLIADGYCRNEVNKKIRLIKQAFAWCVEEELLPGTVFHALQAVKGIRKGRSGVEESEPVKPVPDADVAATLAHLHEPVKSMVELQRLTAMRPGEVFIIRTGDIDRSGPVWIYRPRTHKADGYGKVRPIPIGPRGQAVLKPFLKADPDAFLFSPADAIARKVERRAVARKTPFTPSQRARAAKKKAKPKNPPHDHYDRTNYRHAIIRACDKAFPHPKVAQLRAQIDAAPKGHRRLSYEALKRWCKDNSKELREWRQAHRWHPNQLRHSAATEIRRRFGLEASQVVLGHSRADVTQVYAERDLAAAVEVAAAIG